MCFSSTCKLSLIRQRNEYHRATEKHAKIWGISTLETENLKKWKSCVPNFKMLFCEYMFCLFVFRLFVFQLRTTWPNCQPPLYHLTNHLLSTLPCKNLLIPACIYSWASLISELCLTHVMWCPLSPLGFLSPTHIMTLLILSRKDMLALTSGMRKYGNVDGAQIFLVCFNVLFCQVKTRKRPVFVCRQEIFYPSFYIN